MPFSRKLLIMGQFLLIVFYLAILLSCSSQPLKSREHTSTLSPAEAQADPNYPLALAFNNLLKDLPEEETHLEIAKKECHKNPSLALCSPLKKLKVLKKLLSKKTTVYQPLGIKPLAPLAPIFLKNRITNWQIIRKTPIPNLLKGFLSLTKEQLQWVSQRSQMEKKCPNNAAIAAAATLEDYLPDEIPFTLLASLYERGGICTKNSPIDREHFLTRSGIFYFISKDYKKASAILAKINPTDAYSGRTAYWLYRSKKQEGDTHGPSQVLSRLAKHHRFSFHNLVASHQENQEPPPEHSRSLSFPTRSSKFKQFNNDIQSVELLIRLGFEESAHLIVDWLLTQPKTLEPGLRVYLAQLGDAQAKVMQLPGILMFRPELISKETLTLNFPQAYFPLFEKYRRGTSPYLLLALARRESSFNPKAVSPANAQGLLQMNPDTVKELYPENKFDLLDAETNITIASKYLEKVLDEMNGDLPLTLAAYNAGEAQAKNWKKRYPREDKVMWIDLIPYRETRDYVANVLSSYHWYRKLYENNSDFSDLLVK